MSATEKISITIGRGELRDAKRLASQLGLSLSTFIARRARSWVAEQARREAAKAVLAGFLPEDGATLDEMASLLARWGEAGRPEVTPPARTRVLSRAVGEDCGSAGAAADRWGFTSDTGALIGLERARHNMRKVYSTAVACGVPITVPSVVIAEWWRAGVKEKGTRPDPPLRARRSDQRSRRPACGVALTLVPGVQTIDAIVMASASLRGPEVVYTSDPDDLLALREGVPRFAMVRIERA